MPVAPGFETVTKRHVLLSPHPQPFSQREKGELTATRVVCPKNNVMF